jgi:tetratricopeptide (TPR) repeat protein
LVSQALALDPANAAAHNSKAWILHERGRFEEAIAERERTLALDPADLNAMMSMAWDHLGLGRYEKGLEIFDRAIRLSPRSPELRDMYSGKSWAFFGLKQYDQAIDWARQAIAAGPGNAGPYQGHNRGVEGVQRAIRRRCTRTRQSGTVLRGATQGRDAGAVSAAAFLRP